VESSSHNFLLPLIIYFYYAAYYLFFVELKQMKHYGWRKYFDIYNVFDLITLLTSVILMTICLSTNFELQDGFGGINVINPNLVIMMSFSILLIWCEFVSKPIHREWS